MTLTAYAITRPGKEAVLFREKPNAERWIANAGDASAKLVELTTPLERVAQAEPVAHLVAMSNGDDDAWFEVADGDGKYDFPVYAAPRLPRDVLMAVAREVQRTAIQSCDEAGGDMGALHGIDLDAIVDSYAEKAEQQDAELVTAADCALRYIANRFGVAVQLEPFSAHLTASMLASSLMKYKTQQGQDADVEMASAIGAAESAEKSAQAEPVNQQMLAAMKEARESMQFANDSPCGGIQDTIWMMHRPQTLFDFMDAAIAAAEAAQAQHPVAGGRKFFAYDDETGFDLFDSEVDAKKAAQASIDEWRAIADHESWPEEVENVCWGVVLGASKEIRTGDVGDGSGDWYSDYTLADISQAQEGGAE